MATFRYKLLNGGGVMLMKRWPIIPVLFGIWRDHENFDNYIRKHEAEMQRLHEELVVANNNRLAAMRKKKEIIEAIDQPNGKMKGLGEPYEGKSFSGLRKRDRDKPGQDWKTWVKALKGTKKVSGDTETYTLESSGIPSDTQQVIIPPADRKRLENTHNNSNQRGNQKGNQRN